MRRGTREPCTLKGPWHAVPPAPSRHHGAPRCSNYRHLPHHRCCRLLVPKATRMPILRTLIELARQDEAMGKKPAGAGAGAGWLATVRKVFKPASKDMRHAKKQRGGELVDGGGDAAEVVSVEHFPAAETSPEVTNEAIGTVVWLDREGYGEVEGARRQHRGVAAAAAASRVARAATTRGMTGGREERAAVRIQAFYRGYLARRALRALRGLVRLQALVRGHQVRRQVHRTMRCMQALVRAQDRFRARRLVTSPYAGRPVVAQRHPTSLLVGPGNRHALAHRQHGGRRSFGHDRVGFDDVQLDDRDMAMAQAHSSVSHYALQGTWDAVRADGMLLRQHDTAAARGETIDPAYAYEFQHRRRQTEELQERDNKRNAGSRQHWMDVSHAGLQSHQRHAPERTNNHGAAETSYVTAAATDGVSENTVEMDQEAARKNPTRDLYPAVRSPVIPGYMAATESARAKARTATPPAVASRAHARTRSGSAAANGNSSTLAANLGWGLSHSNGGGGVGAPESSCSSDRTPPTLGERSRQAPA